MALGASTDALVADYWRADGRDAAPSSLVSKLADVLRRQVEDESRSSPTGGPVLELFSLALIAPTPACKAAFERVRSRTASTTRPDAAADAPEKRSRQQTGVLDALERRRSAPGVDAVLEAAGCAPGEGSSSLLPA